MGDLHACGKPCPHSLNDDVYDIPGPPPAFLHSTLKSGRKGLGTRLPSIYILLVRVPMILVGGFYVVTRKACVQNFSGHTHFVTMPSN